MKTSIKKIKEAFDAISQVFYSKSTNYALQLLAECKTEEKSHRSGDFYRYHPSAPSVADMAKLFAVRRVAEYARDLSLVPRAGGYNHTQKSCFIAAGIACEFHAEIIEALHPFGLSELSALDYCDYVKAQNPTN